MEGGVDDSINKYEEGRGFSCGNGEEKMKKMKKMKMQIASFHQKVQHARFTSTQSAARV
jgi:hypothetical protein